MGAKDPDPLFRIAHVSTTRHNKKIHSFISAMICRSFWNPLDLIMILLVLRTWAVFRANLPRAETPSDPKSFPYLVISYRPLFLISPYLVSQFVRRQKFDCRIFTTPSYRSQPFPSKSFQFCSGLDGSAGPGLNLNNIFKSNNIY